MPMLVDAQSKAEVCGRLFAGIAGSNAAEGMDVCLLCLYAVLSCTFATSWSLVQMSPTVCLNKITKPPMWGSQGP
jgi:hypothetical protein